jgi:hypothetical protein
MLLFWSPLYYECWSISDDAHLSLEKHRGQNVRAPLETGSGAFERGPSIDGVSRGFGLSLRETDAGEANIADYTTDTFGGNVNFGIPLSEHDTARIQFE